MRTTGLRGAFAAIALAALAGVVVDRVSWAAAFIMLGAGALLGPLFMLRLRSLPESERLAGGRR